MNVCMYSDSTNMFSREFCNYCNIVYIDVEDKLVFKYFIRHVLADFISDDNVKQELSVKAIYEEWLDEYTADDTIGLWEFLMRNDKRPKVNITLVQRR